MLYYIRFFFIIALTILIISCAAPPVPRDARLYCINTGTIITGQIVDARQTHGWMYMFDPNTGETFTGEYTSIPTDSSNLAYVASHWANAYGFSFNRPRMIYGEAILMGNTGANIEIVYAVDRNSLHGYGVGRDNRGNRYKVHF